MENKDFRSEVVLNEAVNETVKENPAVTDSLENLVRKSYRKFIENKIDAFPSVCREARRVNYLARRELFSVGNPKGWSEKKTFMLDYIIPKELYLFMQNLVYSGFWSEANEKVWRSFMEAVLRGDDPMTLLMKVKAYYGSSQEMKKAGLL